MSVPSPWSVKGVQPKAREAAKDLARREGLTLGEWLNRLIGDVDEDGNVVASRENTPTYAPPNASQAYQQEPVYAPQPVPAHAPQQGYTPQYAPYFAPSLPPFPAASDPIMAAPAQGWQPQRDNDNNRLTAALEQLTRRLDNVAGQSFVPPPQTNANAHDRAGALSAGLIDRVEASERLAETALGRVDASLVDVRQTQAALGERLRAMESNDPNHKSLAALRGLETALSRLSQQVFEADERTQALEGRVEQRLADVTAKLSADTGLSERVGEIEHVTQQALETLDTSVSVISRRLATTEAIASDTSGRLANAMIDLSARLTGVEQIQDDTQLEDRVGILGERLEGIEDVTTQAIESVDKGLGIVSQRVAATEALAQATNERLVEALIDLSARLVHLENIDSQEQARDLLSALEAKNKELTRRLETLDNKIDATRSDLTNEVKTAVATGVDGRMAEIAKALADRLDVSERRSGEALEKIGAEMARASISLDQRLREIEERGTVDIASAMRNEMSKMGRAIDERMASMERRDASALDQAGGHIQQLAQTLTEKLDASEARAQSAVQNVSSQMEQLAQRLQARQDETARNLVARMEDGEARGNHELQQSLAQIAQDIRSAEDRAKAVSAPLHRDFNSLIDRLDQVEATSLSSLTEQIPFGDQIVSVGPQGDYSQQSAFDIVPEQSRDPFGALAPTTSYRAPETDTFSFDDVPQQAQESVSTRRPGFGAPFPGNDTSGFGVADNNQASLDSLGSGGAFGSEFEEDPFSMETQGLGGIGSAGVQARKFDEFSDDLSETWSEPNRTSRGGGDYLTNARNAASRAALESSDAQKLAKNKRIGKAGQAKINKAGTLSAFALDSNKGDKAKPKLSPVGIAAAAALVATTGLLAVRHFTADTSQNEKPAALNPSVQAPNSGASAPEAAPQATTILPAPMLTPSTATRPVVAPKSVVAANPAKVPNLEAPVVKTPVVKTPEVKAALIPPREAPKSTSEMRRFAATESAKADQAAARARAVQARLPASQVTPSPVRVPFGQTAPQATRSAPVPQIATPKTGAAIPPGVARPVAGTAQATPRTPTPTPRVAVASANTNRAPLSKAAAVPTGSARQLYDQAIARQQAGDAAGAATLMRAAADTGDARSINRLAKMYERGEGVTRDPAQARALTERAASRGSAQAMHNLGVYYAEGEGPARDMNKAADSFRRAASKGVTDSQFNLGAMAEQGLGVQRSEREAYYWYSVAGRNGDRDAAAKTRELAARLPPAEKVAEDQRVAQFRAEPGGDD